MRLSDEQYEEIKKVVADTFVEYGVKSIPISAFEMAIKMGISVVPYSALSQKKQEAAKSVSLDGFSTEDDRYNWTIYYNDSCSNYGRINQTIMHEIGHYALGHTEEGEVEEAEAKFFSKYALAPPALIHNLGQDVTIELIMERFDISYQAAVYAYEYYLNWLRFGEHDYTSYEMKMLDQVLIA